MPATASWTLIIPPAASGGAQFEGGAAPALPCPIDPYTQQDLLDLFDRILPGHYITPLKAPGPGYELLQAFAAVGARLSQAVEHYACSAYILSSSGGGFALGTVQLLRSAVNPEGIALTVKVGTVVKSSRGGRRYLTTEDVLFGPNDLGPFTVGIIAEVKGYEFNEPGPIVAADGTLLEGEIDTIETLLESAPSQPLPNAGTSNVSFSALIANIQVVSGMVGAAFSPDSVGRFVTFAGAANAGNNGSRQIVSYISQTSVEVRNMTGVVEGPTAAVSWQEYSQETDAADLTIQVVQASTTTGGADASLDAHGKDRNIPRGTGETDDSYRGRIRALPDNISPDAVERALQQLLFPLGGGFDFIETWAMSYQTCWDAPRDPIPGSSFDPNLFCYDDPRPATPFRNRWLDLNDMRGAFIVVVPNYQWIRDNGMAFGPELPPYTKVTTGNTGVVAAVSVWPGGLGKLRVFNIAGMSGASVGRIMTISGAANAKNNGDWVITDLISPTAVLIQNQYGATDANSFAIGWEESNRTVDEPDVLALQGPLGARAVCAYDVPADLGFGYIQGAWDGFDQPKRTVYLNLYDTLQRIKAAGTSASVELQGQ